MTTQISRPMKISNHQDLYISLIIPVYNEAVNLEWHHQKILSKLNDSKFSYELIYIDDGSSDESLDILRKLKLNSKYMRYISFSRNFGKEAAISAGLNTAKGDCALIIDADGQHPIELIDKFVDKWQKGNDIVVGIRESNQGEGIVKSLGSRLFYVLLKVIDGSRETKPGSTDFRLLDRKVIDAYNSLTERNRISRHLIDWLGFKQATVSFRAHARHAGKASYSYGKLVKLAIDGAITHSTRPLKLIGILGMLISSVSLLLVIFLSVEMYLLSDPLHLAITGTAFLAIFLSFLVGIVLICQGLIALYLENVYHETQNRPLYIIYEEK